MTGRASIRSVPIVGSIAILLVGGTADYTGEWFVPGGPQDGNGSESFGRLLDSRGQPVGAEFHVNTATAGEQNHPAGHPPPAIGRTQPLAAGPG